METRTMIDFSPLERGETNLFGLSEGVTVDDLRVWTRESIATLLAIIRKADDAMITFVPHDPDAHDPWAEGDMQHTGWTLGHLVAHVTASSEESAAIAAMLARGIPYPAEPRLRYETPWEDIDTQAKAKRRLRESLRMRLGALAMFPDAPHLDTYRQLAPSGLARWGPLNAPAQFLSGLRHEVGHYAQFREVLRQAREAANSVMA
jgi:hypothetical protein